MCPTISLSQILFQFPRTEPSPEQLVVSVDELVGLSLFPERQKAYKKPWYPLRKQYLLGLH